MTLKGLPVGQLLHRLRRRAGLRATRTTIGIAMGGWGADWPNGYGFLDELVDGNTIASTGNTNISSSTTR